MLNEIRKAFKPPYQTRDVYTIFVVFFIMITLPLTVLQVTQTRDNLSLATTNTTFDNSSKPIVELKKPLANTTLAGVVSVTAEASDQLLSLTQLDLLVNGNLVETVYNQNEGKTFSATINWDTTKNSNGEKLLVVAATNSQGQKTSSSPTRVVVNNLDEEKPTIGFTQPADGDYVTGNSYKIKLEASDNSGVKIVRLYIDGKLFQETSQLPYDFNWDLSKIKAGEHIFEAIAVDFSDNTTSQVIKIYRSTQTINTN